jgi:hypothetical protein
VERQAILNPYNGSKIGEGLFTFNRNPLSGINEEVNKSRNRIPGLG